MLAIIPARGGSKGLPNKNVKLLKNKPLIAYTIEEALKVPIIDKVFVSTDDEEIAEISRKYGAECNYLRPAELAKDDSKAIDVYNYVIKKFEEDGIKYNDVVILQPTSPLRTSKHILEAIALFLNKDADSVISYCEEHHPVVWHKYVNEHGKFENIFGDHTGNRQKERKSYYPNGAIFVFKSLVLKEGMYYTPNSYAYIMERINSIDIDTMDDFELVDFYLGKNA